jgi:hypothetical protein
MGDEVIDYGHGTTAGARSGASWLGVASCAVCVLAAFFFVRQYGWMHRIPVSRGVETLGLYTNAVESNTSTLYAFAFCGAGLAVAGLWQRRKQRGYAAIGLVLNLAALISLYILNTTGGD